MIFYRIWRDGLKYCRNRRKILITAKCVTKIYINAEIRIGNKFGKINVVYKSINDLTRGVM
jgi:hypothetical protein